MTWKLSRFSIRPAGSWLGVSSAGTNVALAGAATAWIVDCTATSVYSSQTACSPAKACAANAADTTVSAELVISTSRRRSVASATVPPIRPMASSGTISARPIAPTANGDRVIR